MGNKGSTDSTVTYQYPAEMTQLAQDQWGKGKEIVDWYQQNMLPYMQQVIASNQALQPLNDQLLRQQYGHMLGTDGNDGLLGLQAQASAEGYKQATHDLQADAAVKDAKRQATLDDLQRSDPVSAKFYEEALKGIDPQTQMDLASSDVSQSFGAQRRGAVRQAAALGVDPSSSRFLSSLGDMNIEEAKASGLARTQARRYAEDANFQRLGTAMNARQGLSTLQGGNSMTGTYSPTGTASGTSTLSYGLSDPTGLATGMYSGASGLYGKAQGYSSSGGTTGMGINPSGALTGAAGGSIIGTSILPGLGSMGGAVAGGLLGLFGGGK